MRQPHKVRWIAWEMESKGNEAEHPVVVLGPLNPPAIDVLSIRDRRTGPG